MEQLTSGSAPNTKVEFWYNDARIEGVVEKIVDEIIVVKIDEKYIDLALCDEVGFDFDYLPGVKIPKEEDEED